MAHVDHGKSTLADRFLEITKTVDPRKMQPQYLDRMELERERGITIKMAPVRMIYKVNHTEIPNSIRRPADQIPNSSNSKQEFVLNLIDTPGHSDFSYEVSRALAAVEGAILLIDATQGIQAQTIANYAAAKKLGLAIIPAINKIDLNPEASELKRDIRALTGIGEEEIFLVSAKTGEGVERLLGAVIERVPPPRSLGAALFDNQGSSIKDQRLEIVATAARALLFDSVYDSHKGIIAFVRMFDGAIVKGDPLWLCAAGARAEAFEVGYFIPDLRPGTSLGEGEIGYVALGIREPRLVRIGDTLTRFETRGAAAPLSGYREPQPVVFASFYPQGADDFEILKNAIEKLHLTDSSFSFEPEASDALGRGFRLGFLGTLHLEIIAERIRREFGIDVITTAPSVAYEIKRKNGTVAMVYKPQDFPQEGQIQEIKEPFISIHIISRKQDYGTIMELTGHYRMAYQDVEYFGTNVLVKYLMPLAELLTDFHDRLKSTTSGYASVHYELKGYETADILKMDILLAGQEIPEFSRVLPRDKLDREARRFVGHLKEVLPRENFPVAIQACAGGRIVARENLPALKKDVTGYLYGGDRSRKMKLWKKQQRGKKKLLSLARVNIPHEVYIKILKRGIG